MSPAVLCQNRALKPVELSKVGTVLMCPRCDRQPGYKAAKA